MPSLPELALLIAGIILVIVAATWRISTRRRAAGRLRLALAGPDPLDRRAAVDVIAAQGLSRHLSILVTLLRTEADPMVLQTLAEAVARNQWEPADDRRLVDLRLWASRRFAQNVGAVTGERATADLSLSPRLQSRGILPPLPRPISDGASGVTVMVTGTGGAAGVAVVRALLSKGHRVVAADADPSAVGLRLGHDRGVLPAGSHPDFVEEVCVLAARTGTQIVVPTVAEELVALAEGDHALSDAGIRTWVPVPEAVERCTDKWTFAKVLGEAQVLTPATALGEDLSVPGPWVVKPRFGRGSRDVYLVDEPDELHWAVRRVREPIVQTRLEGWEFTVDALVDRAGELVGAVPRRRLETKAGISTKGLVFEGRAVVADVARVLQAIGLTGPANVQGFVGPDDAVTFVEVNPRFSGGLPLSLAAGADLVGEYLRGVVGDPVRPERLEFRPGVTMLRHFDEVFEG